jgi:hypothetical protein
MIQGKGSEDISGIMRAKNVRCSESEEDGGGRREMKKIGGKRGRVENINIEGTLK